MSRDSKIEWTDRTWNPVRGCTRVSPGCVHCYAETLSARNLPGMRSPTTGEPFARRTPSGPRWTGRVELIESKLAEPTRWKKPQRIFVNSMSDLFHESLSHEQIWRVFDVMSYAAWKHGHTFQVLTKRPARMLEFVLSAGEQLKREGAMKVPWPIPNVWLGVSVENQAAADERIPLLLQTPAAVRFLSCEPLLGPVSLDNVEHAPGEFFNALDLEEWSDSKDAPEVLASPGAGALIDWVIAGGESGPGARPMHPDWARSLRDQCVTARVPFFFKQWGEWVPREWGSKDPKLPRPDGASRIGFFGSDRRFLDAASHGARQNMARIGKTRAGRELDGLTWDQFPEPAER